MEDELPQRRRHLRRSTDRSEGELHSRIDDVFTALDTTLDVTGGLATQVNQQRATISRLDDRYGEQERWRAAIEVQMPTVVKAVEGHEQRLQKLERWQAYTLGITAVIAIEIPIVATLVASHPWHP